MKVTTPEEMRKIDQAVIEGLGIPGCVLMELAGKGCVDALLEEYGDVEGEKVVVVCGLGNNGGDGFVVARRLHSLGADVEIVLLGEEERIKGDARIYLEVAKKLNIPFTTPESIDDASIVVDAIFGTGFRGKPEGIFEEVIKRINDSDAFVLAVDIPSGVSGRTGEVEGEAVRADLTATMGLPKRGLLLFPGREYAGRIYVVDIAIPSQVLENAEVSLYMTEAEDVKSILPERPAWGHKGTFGKVLCICGSRGFTGAASLTSMSALVAGCGLSYLVIPASLNPVLEEKLTEVITIPAPEEDGVLSEEAYGLIKEWIEKCDVVAIGPGLSTRETTGRLVERIVSEMEKPCVIDADGLNLLRGKSKILKGKKNIIITPHPGEFSRLTGKSIQELQRDRVESAREFAIESGINVLFKGAPTIIASHDGRCYLNPTGNSGLGSGGTGDVLTGLIAGFMAQGVPPFESGVVSAYIHGRAGDLAKEELTEYSLTASDVLSCVPLVLKELKGEG